MLEAGLLDTALINSYNSFWMALLAKRSFFLTVKERYHIIQVPPYGLMVIYLRLPCPPLAKRGSLTHSQALALSKRARDVTALRCSEPLRYKVGGASKPSPWLCGMGPPGDNMLIGTVRLMFGFQHKHINSIVVQLLFYNFEVFLMHATDSYSSSTEVEDELAVTVYADNVAFIVFEWS